MSLAWSSVKSLSIPVGGVSRDVKRVTAGGVTLWEKPNPLPYDAEVEYIESTGTQWIDTGVYPGNSDSFSINISGRWIKNNTTEGVFASFYKASGLGLNLSCTSIRMYVYTSSQTNITETAGDFTLAINFTGSALTATINGRAISAGWDANLKGSNLPLYLWNRPDTLARPSRSGSRIYSMSVYTNGVLVRDFQPVRVGSGANAVGCLYDKLGTGGMNPDGTARNDGLYFNRGSGAFVVGPDNNS